MRLASRCRWFDGYVSAIEANPWVAHTYVSVTDEHEIRYVLTRPRPRAARTCVYLFSKHVAGKALTRSQPPDLFSALSHLGTVHLVRILEGPALSSL